MNTTTNGNNYDHYKVNFSVSLAPKDFKLHKKPHHLRKTIFIGIALGRINQLIPGSPHVPNDVYNHR